MGIEIQKPELERRVLEGIRSGRFPDVDELLTKAIDALSVTRVAGGRPRLVAVPRCGKRTRQSQWRLGVPQHTDAGCRRIREP